MPQYLADHPYNRAPSFFQWIEMEEIIDDRLPKYSYFDQAGRSSPNCTRVVLFHINSHAGGDFTRLDSPKAYTSRNGADFSLDPPYVEEPFAEIWDAPLNIAVPGGSFVASYQEDAEWWGLSDSRITDAIKAFGLALAQSWVAEGTLFGMGATLACKNRSWRTRIEGAQVTQPDPVDPRTVKIDGIAFICPKVQYLT